MTNGQSDVPLLLPISPAFLAYDGRHARLSSQRSQRQWPRRSPLRTLAGRPRSTSSALGSSPIRKACSAPRWRAGRASALRRTGCVVELLLDLPPEQLGLVLLAGTGNALDPD